MTTRKTYPLNVWGGVNFPRSICGGCEINGGGNEALSVSHRTIEVLVWCESKRKIFELSMIIENLSDHPFEKVISKYHTKSKIQTFGISISNIIVIIQ